MTASVGVEGKEKDKETILAEEAKPGGVTRHQNVLFSNVSNIYNG